MKFQNRKTTMNIEEQQQLEIKEAEQQLEIKEAEQQLEKLILERDALVEKNKRLKEQIKTR